jgi:hypothetical protein
MTPPEAPMTLAEAKLAGEKYQQEAATMTEKDRAIMEGLLWAAFKTVPEFKGEFRNAVMSQLIGQGSHVTAARAGLLYYGEHVNPIWERIHNKQMTLSTGWNLARTASADSINNSKDPDCAVRDALKEYDELPRVKMYNGIPTRVAAVGSRKAKSERMQPFEAGKDRQFWHSFRKLLSTYFEGKCEGLEPATKELLIRGFETDSKVLVEEFLVRLYGAQRKSKASSEVVSMSVTRHKVLDACHALHMDPPSVGIAVDLEKARRQKKLLARAYHPDSHGGDETTKAKYMEVIEAYQTLEAYAVQLHSVSTSTQKG